jgi:hypothetical protein
MRTNMVLTQDYDFANHLTLLWTCNALAMNTSWLRQQDPHNGWWMGYKYTHQPKLAVVVGCCAWAHRTVRCATGAPTVCFQQLVLTTICCSNVASDYAQCLSSVHQTVGL